MARSLFARWCVVVVVAALLCGCQVDVYSDLTEEQINQMLSVLLRRGVQAEKHAAGKNGYTLSVDEDQLVLALQILKENSLPRETYKSLGDVFGGEGMIASSSEEQARLAYAISQELSDTLSRIDGVLTARVHVVLGVNDAVNNVNIPPSASIFIRHTPDSPVVNYVPEMRELAACSVASLAYDKVSVMLVPVRENVTVPRSIPKPRLIFSEGVFSPLLFLQALALALGMMAVGGGIYLLARRFRARGTAGEKVGQ